MRTWAGTFVVLTLGAALSGCAATTATTKAALDYNEIFAQSRDEVLVTNILRASAHEPMLFSTMGAVSGTVRTSGFLTLPFTNLVGGGTAISPQLTVNGVNPTIQLLPLSDKDFTDGILTPVHLTTVEAFAEQGWDPEFLLSLVVGGVTCPNGTSVINGGYPGAEYNQFSRMFEKVAGRPLVAAPREEPYATLVMPSSEALTFVKDGVGEGKKIASIKPISKTSGSVEVRVVRTVEPDLANLLDTREICARYEAIRPPNAAKDWVPPEPVILLRSVEAIIYFLGTTQRYRNATGADCVTAESSRWPDYRRARQYGAGTADEDLSLFQMGRACGNALVPSNTFLHVRFNGSDYFIRHAEDAPPDSETHCAASGASAFCDRTLNTLAFLDELIALQTSGSTIESSKPLLTIPAQ